VPANFQLVARTGHPSFLDLPWEVPLDEWKSERLVTLIRGISRHVVRFVEYDGTLYALKELPERPARREWTLLRRLEGQGLPVVEAVGVVTARDHDLDAILITRHLEYSLPYRTLFAGAAIPDLRTHLLNALVELLARLHIRGFFWGDCSLSNALFRRDAGALSAYLVDAETGELHGQLSDGQRGYDLDIAQQNVVGELLDVDAEVGLPADLDPDETGEEIVRRYRALWNELTRDETFGPGERYKLDERLHRLNDLGYDVEEIHLDATPSGYRLRFEPHVVEPGHHRHRLLRLTGLDAQENQARRMLNDVARFREALERTGGRTLPESVVASRWRQEVFEPTIAAVPEELWAALPAAEVFHQVLEHRWFLSEQAGKDVGIDEAVRSYVERELPRLPAERIVLEVPGEEEDAEAEAEAEAEL
jgi:tRNA A-37 threonylcarbamoyl transferase component Bud32